MNVTCLTDVKIKQSETKDNILENINFLPDFVKEGIKRGGNQGHKGLTKSTSEVMKKYNA